MIGVDEQGIWSKVSQDPRCPDNSVVHGPIHQSGTLAVYFNIHICNCKVGVLFLLWRKATQFVYYTFYYSEHILRNKYNVCRNRFGSLAMWENWILKYEIEKL